MPLSNTDDCGDDAIAVWNGVTSSPGSPGSEYSVNPRSPSFSPTRVPPGADSASNTYASKALRARPIP